jgi:hypothetical protein
VALTAALAAPAAVRAEAGAPATPAEVGHAHFDQGVQEYNLGHFTEAIAEFEKAYRADPTPIMLFNIAQSYRQLGNRERALFFYRRYLEQAPPDAPNRSEVEQRTKELAQSLEQERDLKQRPPTEVAKLEAGSSAQPGAGGTSGSVQVEPAATSSRSDHMWAVAACLGPSFGTVGRSSVEFPVMLAIRIGATYSFQLPSARLNVALDAMFARLPYQTNTATPADETSTLPGFLVSGHYMRDVSSRFSVGGGVGVGMIWWVGLGAGNPFVDSTTEVTGAIPMPTFEAEVRATMDVRPDLFVIVAPQLLSSLATSGLSDSFSALWRFDLNVGAGYRF